MPPCLFLAGRFRVLEVSENLEWLQAVIGPPLYSLAFFWGHLCWSPHQARDLKRAAALQICMMVVAYVAAAVFDELSAEPFATSAQCPRSMSLSRLATSFTFLPFYFASLRSLFRNKARPAQPQHVSHATLFKYASSCHQTTSRRRQKGRILSCK